jgi:hypothetical protein
MAMPVCSNKKDYESRQNVEIFSTPTVRAFSSMITRK